MSFEQNLRDRISKAPFRSKERDLLKVVLGEYQLKASSAKVTDDNGLAIVKGMLKSNLEKVLPVLAPDDYRRADILEENAVLLSLLPKYLNSEQVQLELEC